MHPTLPTSANSGIMSRFSPSELSARACEYGRRCVQVYSCAKPAYSSKQIWCHKLAYLGTCCGRVHHMNPTLHSPQLQASPVSASMLPRRERHQLTTHSNMLSTQPQRMKPEYIGSRSMVGTDRKQHTRRTNSHSGTDFSL